MGLFEGIGGAVLGGLGGAFANQKEGEKDAGNVYGDVLKKFGFGSQDPNAGASGLGTYIKQAMDAQAQYKGDPTKELQSNPILGQLFGQGGALSRANQQEQDLSSRGFSLQPEDYEAYGQGSGNIARMFGQNEQSLAQSLADRGLSTSGVAGQQFSGLLGNKQEQLAKLQMNIAQQRMQMNQQRLNDTRNFLSQMGSQAQQGINEQQQLGREKASDYNQILGNRANMANSLLGHYQDQQNVGLQQQQQTAHSSGLSNLFGGAVQGGMAGAAMGGMSGGSSKPTTMAGQSNLNGSIFA